jgi:hypothetical protein
MRRFVLKTPCMRCLPQASAAPTTEAGTSLGAVPVAVAAARLTPPSRAHGPGMMATRAFIVACRCSGGGAAMVRTAQTAVTAKRPRSLLIAPK